MDARYLLSLLLLAGAPAHSEPIANLVLTCPIQNAIGQDFGSCFGIVYEIPTNQRIVYSPPAWSRASDLVGSDLVLICKLPVEPGTYSSCRDANGLRSTAFVPKDSVFAGGKNSVTVSKTGGDYSDPVTAANNAYGGDRWCVVPQWPDKPCVMAIGDGVFILSETLSIPEGLAVSGNGRGNTMLVADNGVETAVFSSFAKVKISDLTIVNSQPGGARTIGLKLQPPQVVLGTTVQLHGVAIHVSGAARNIAVVKNMPVEILDSEITAVGQDTSGITVVDPAMEHASVRLERSHVSAQIALEEPDNNFDGVSMLVVDSHVAGDVSFSASQSNFQIVGSQVVGNVDAVSGHHLIKESRIIGNAELFTAAGPTLRHEIIDTYVQGNVTINTGGHNSAFVDGLTVHGTLMLRDRPHTVVRSYVQSATTAPALFLFGGEAHLEQTFVQGALAVAADPDRGGRIDAASSVLAGPVSVAPVLRASCTDTFGADYELLSATCQPQVPQQIP
jgi:hypothetical protein